MHNKIILYILCFTFVLEIIKYLLTIFKYLHSMHSNKNKNQSCKFYSNDLQKCTTLNAGTLILNTI